ncbi:MAG TPA: M28 family peptidase, partial [Gemmatimonadales bacterium]|nr:M28 family peptidase [Gemmatimonadales bacterium]
MRLRVVALLAAIAPPALGQRQATRLVEPPPSVLAAVDSAVYEAHLRFLSDDLLEGRSPGSRGGDLAARYIATQFAAAGLKPVWDAGYLQRVQLLGAASEASLVVGAGRRTIVLDAGTDFVAWPAQPDSVVILDADLVFGGYGIEAPEWGWRDFEPGAVAGKVVMVRPGEPGGAADSTLFRGRAATRHSRWVAKLDYAARAGAAGILFIHSPEAGRGPWAAVRSKWQRETFLPERASLHGLRFAAWISADAARRIVEATGRDYDLLMRRADVVGFSAIDLDARVAVDMRSRFRSLVTPNVVGMLGAPSAGTDGAVLLVGHYDHLGIGPPVDGDSVYNGAVDNASGIAGLLTLARAMAAAPR